MTENVTKELLFETLKAIQGKLETIHEDIRDFADPLQAAKERGAKIAHENLTAFLAVVDLPGLADVVAEIGNPFVAIGFLIRPDPDLSHRQPIDVLKSGDVPIVLESARRKYGPP